MLTKLFISAVAIIGITTKPSSGETAIEAIHTAYQENADGDISLNFHLRSTTNCQAEDVITRRFDNSVVTADGGDSNRGSDRQSCSCSGTCHCSGSCVCSGSGSCFGGGRGLWGAGVSGASAGSAAVSRASTAPASEICEFCFCNATNASRYCERVDCTSATPAAKNTWNSIASLSPWSSIKAAVPFQVYTVDDGFCYVYPIDPYTGRTMKCFTRLQI